MTYLEKDYREAINFGLNYPPDFDLIFYDDELDTFRLNVFDGGWYDIILYGNYVRSCLKWKGKKAWK